jgi:hypothetical protein
MNMGPGLRKFALTAHIISSVGFVGAVAAFLALAVVGLTSQNPQMVRAAYPAMELITWFVIVPFSFASLLTGLVQSLGTAWGLFRHYWVLVKFGLTVFTTIVLMVQTTPMNDIAGIAADTILSGSDFLAIRSALIVHASGGLLVLLVATALSVFKPWGMTGYGARKRYEQRALSQS